MESHVSSHGRHMRRGSYLVSCPPVTVFVAQLVRTHDLLGRLQDHLGGYLGTVDLPSSSIYFIELNIQSD